MNGNGNGVWKVIAVAFIGLTIGQAFAIWHQPTDFVQERELNQRILELQQKQDDTKGALIRLQDQVQQLQIQLAGAGIGEISSAARAPQREPRNK